MLPHREARMWWLALACGEPPKTGDDVDGSLGQDSGADPDDTDDTAGEPGDTAETTTPPPDPPEDAWFVAEILEPAVAVRSNVPIDAAGCVPEAGTWACDDVDGDGLTDAWEDGVLERLVPAIRFDEEEPLIDDPTAVLAMVARVTPVDDRVRVFVMLGYHIDYGRCGLSGHNGDSERVALDLERLADGPGDVGVVGAYTAAHEGTINDGGRVFTGADLGLLSFPVDAADGQPRWRVYSSDGKHATYGTVEDCEASVVPCLEEDCEADLVPDPTPYTWLAPVVNAGEPDLPRVTDLTPIGFPGEDAWADQDFCGGLGGSGCAGPVLEKLTVDPF